MFVRSGHCMSLCGNGIRVCEALCSRGWGKLFADHSEGTISGIRGHNSNNALSFTENCGRDVRYLILGHREVTKGGQITNNLPTQNVLARVVWNQYSFVSWICRCNCGDELDAGSTLFVVSRNVPV